MLLRNKSIFSVMIQRGVCQNPDVLQLTIFPNKHLHREMDLLWESAEKQTLTFLHGRGREFQYFTAFTDNDLLQIKNKNQTLWCWQIAKGLAGKAAVQRR